MLMQRYASRRLASGVRPWQRSESSLRISQPDQATQSTISS